MRKILKALKEVVYALASLFSRIANAVFFGGSELQTTSARAHMDAKRGYEEWEKRRKWINRIFFFQEDHCQDAFNEDLRRARRTISIYESFSK